MLPVLLGACGVDENESNVGNNQSQDQNITLSADNTIDNITNGLESYVSLEEKIHATSSLGDNTVSEVVLLSDQSACRDIDVYPLGYSVNSTDYIGTCVYEYTVQNTVDLTARAVAYSTAVIQEDAVGSIDKFGSLAETAEVSTSLVINLANELAGQIPDGYTLSETITNLGVGSASLDINNQTITFISDEPGYSQIIYSYENETQVKIGSINIAVSTDLNTAPVAPNIDYSADMNNETVNINTDVIIDVGAYISDPDGEPLQLVYVDSWYASVVPSDISDENNTSFTFNTDRAGEHFVTYAISDHNGGYDIGKIRIEVYDPNNAASWSNIQQGLKVFYGPLTKGDADAQRVEYSSTHFDTNGSNVATFNFSQATELCGAKGRLPTSLELIDLANVSSIGPAEYDGWPVDIGYFASDNGQASIVSLDTGLVVSSNVGGQYVTCVNEGGFIIDTDNSFITDVVTNGGGEDNGIAIVITKLSFNGQPISGEEITASIPSDVSANFLDSSSVTTNDDGIATFKLVDLKAEDVELTVEYEDQQRNIDISFIADISTAILTSETTIDGQPYSEGANVVKATLKDSNDNLISGEVIEFTVSNYADTTLSTTNFTDEKGEQDANIEWSSSESTIDETMVVTSTYKRNDIDLNSFSEITFKSATFDSLILLQDHQAMDGGINVAVAHISSADGTPKEGVEVRFKPSSNDVSVNGEVGKIQYIVVSDANGDAIANLSYNGLINQDEGISASYNISVEYGEKKEIETTWELYPTIIQITSGINANTTCSDLNYYSLSQSSYINLFNSIYKPNVDSWIHTSFTWSYGLSADLYGRLGPKEQNSDGHTYYDQMAYIKDSGSSGYTEGTWSIIAGTSLGPNALVCQKW